MAYRIPAGMTRKELWLPEDTATWLNWASEQQGTKPATYMVEVLARHVAELAAKWEKENKKKSKTKKPAKSTKQLTITEEKTT